MTLTRRNFMKMVAATAAVSTTIAPIKDSPFIKAAQANEKPTEQIIRSACRNCYGRCGIDGTVRNGRLVKIEGVNELFSEGTLCSRAFAIPQLMYSPLRLKYPMKRVGKRGEGKWKRITWEEAMTTITQEFKKIIENYGPGALIHQYGTGRDMSMFNAVNRLFNELGSTNTFGVGNLCWLGSYMTSMRIYGDETQYTGWDGNNTKCLILWSRQERSRGYYDWLIIERAQRRGVKVISVDPRYTTTASKSDVWLNPRPGTDMALVLAFINQILASNKYDKEFIKSWTNGPFLVNDDEFLLRESDLVEGGSEDKFAYYDNLSKSIRYWDGKALAWDSEKVDPAIIGSYEANGKKYKTAFQLFTESVAEWTPKKAAEITWVDEAKIKEATKLYIDNSPGAAFTRGQKVEFSINTSGISHAFTNMMALAGNFDVKGGQNIARQPGNGVDTMLFDFVPLAKGIQSDIRKEVRKNIEKYSVAPQHEILGRFGGAYAATTHAMSKGVPFQARGYFGMTSEPILGCADSTEVRDGFLNLDFSVNVDLYMTPTGELCDIVLPAAHPNEVDRVEWAHSGHGYPASHTALIRQPFTAPLGEARDDMDICFDLAKRMGVNMGWEDKYDFFNFMLKPVGMDFEQFRDKKFVISEPKYKRFETGELRRDKRKGFQTPNGKFNLYSEDLKKYGWGALPMYIEQPITPVSRPDLLKDYPYILLTGGRSHAYFHTEYRQSPWMREIHTFPTVQLNPETAKKHGISNGDWIYIETYHGKCKQRAELTNTLHPNMIHLEHDWWFPEKDVKDELHGAFVSNCNVLIENNGPYDPAIGTDNYGGLCKIYKATDGKPEGIFTTAEELKAFLPKKDA